MSIKEVMDDGNNISRILRDDHSHRVSEENLQQRDDQSRKEGYVRGDQYQSMRGQMNQLMDNHPDQARLQ